MKRNFVSDLISIWRIMSKCLFGLIFLGLGLVLGIGGLGGFVFVVSGLWLASVMLYFFLLFIYCGLIQQICRFLKFVFWNYCQYFFFLGKSIQSFVINCFMGLVGFKGLIIRVSLLGFIIWQVLCMFLVGFGQYLIFFVEIQWLKLLEGRGRFLVFF